MLRTIRISLDLGFNTGFVLVFKPFKYDNGIGIQILNLTVGVALENTTEKIEEVTENA